MPRVDHRALLHLRKARVKGHPSVATWKRLDIAGWHLDTQNTLSASLLWVWCSQLPDPELV